MMFWLLLLFVLLESGRIKIVGRLTLINRIKTTFYFAVEISCLSRVEHEKT